MRTLKWVDISTNIRSDEEINFIGRVLTPLHILGMEALILHLKEKGIVCKGYIMAIAHSETGLGISEDAFHSNLYEGVEPVFLSDREEPWVSFKALYEAKKNEDSSRRFFFANPFEVELGYISQIISIRPDDKMEVFVTEEGNANYLRSPYGMNKTMIVGLGLKKSARYFFESCIKNRLIVYYAQRKITIHEFLMLERVNGRWTKNNFYVRSLLKILKSVRKSEDYSQYEGAIIICPSLLYESGFLKKREDLEIYKQIRNTFGNDVKWIVKPHPREKSKYIYDILNCAVDSKNRLSTEEILANLEKPPIMIIGDSSTVLVSANVLYGIKTVSINKLYKKCNLRDKHYFDGFNKCFNGMCLMPKSFDELLEHIR